MHLRRARGRFLRFSVDELVQNFGLISAMQNPRDAPGGPMRL